MKALGKHTFGALKHGAASFLHSANGTASKQIASHSGQGSALAHAYGLAAQKTLPLAENERATAGEHLRAARSAAKDLLFKTSTYDASAVAENLAGLKMDNSLKQRLKKLVLEVNPKEPASIAATLPAAEPHPTAGRATAAAIGYAVVGVYHKAKAGTHLMGAKVQAGATLVTQAHHMAQASHSAKAAVSFADASVQVKHAMHYGTISMRAQTARAAGAFTKQSERFSNTALARSLAGLSGSGKAVLGQALHRLRPKLTQLAHQILGPHADSPYRPKPNTSAAPPKPLAQEGDKQ